MRTYTLSMDAYDIVSVYNELDSHKHQLFNMIFGHASRHNQKKSEDTGCKVTCERGPRDAATSTS